MKACYIVPPIGGTLSHESGCDPKTGFKEGLWLEPWAQEGTRPYEECDQQRRFCAFTQKGPAETLPFGETHLPLCLDWYKWTTSYPAGYCDIQPQLQEIKDAFNATEKTQHNYMATLPLSLFGQSPASSPRKTRGGMLCCCASVCACLCVLSCCFRPRLS